MRSPQFSQGGWVGNKMTRWLASFFVLQMLLIAGTSSAQRSRQLRGEVNKVEFELRRWRPNLVSELQFGTSETINDPFGDFVPEQKESLEFRLMVRIIRTVKIRINRVDPTFIVENVLVDNATAGEASTSSRTNRGTKIQMTDLNAGIEWDLWRGNHGSLGVIGQFSRFDAAVGFEELNATAPAKDKFRVELPTFGARVRMNLTQSFWVTTEWVGMKMDSRGVISDFDINAAFSTSQRFFIEYGYRNFYVRDYTVEVDGGRATFRVRGQYFGVGIRF